MGVIKLQAEFCVVKSSDNVKKAGSCILLCLIGCIFLYSNGFYMLHNAWLFGVCFGKQETSLSCSLFCERAFRMQWMVIHK